MHTPKLTKSVLKALLIIRDKKPLERVNLPIGCGRIPPDGMRELNAVMEFQLVEG